VIQQFFNVKLNIIFFKFSNSSMYVTVVFANSIPSPLHSFIPGLLHIVPTVAFHFFFRTDSIDSPDCLPILLSIPVSFTF